MNKQLIQGDFQRLSRYKPSIKQMWETGQNSVDGMPEHMGDMKLIYDKWKAQGFPIEDE